VRYVIYCIVFFIFILCSFWLFAWRFKTECAISIIERSCLPYKVTIEKFECINTEIISLQNIQFYSPGNNENPIFIISEVRACSSLRSWIRWLLLPSRAPLYLSKLDIYIKKEGLLTFELPRSPFLVSIDTVTVYMSDGTQKSFEKQSGLLSEILLEVFDSIPK
jgi:hypothetical protein